MSRRTSSLSTLTTVPLTMSPSSKLTMVPAMASSRDMPSRSSDTTCLGMYSPSSSVVGSAVGASGDCGSTCSDITRRLLSGLLPAPTLGAHREPYEATCNRCRAELDSDCPGGISAGGAGGNGGGGGAERLCAERPLGDQEQFGVVDLGCAAFVATRRHRPQIDDVEPGLGGQQPQLTRRVARGPEVELTLVAGFVPDRRALVVHARRDI